jgi:hypothetical protein
MSLDPRYGAYRRGDDEHGLTCNPPLSDAAVAETNPVQPPVLIWAGTIAPVSHPARGGGQQDDRPIFGKDLQ